MVPPRSLTFSISEGAEKRRNGVMGTRIRAPREDLPFMIVKSAKKL